MEASLKFTYDRDADILHIDKVKPYAEQETEELGDDMTVRINPETEEIENVEVLFFSMRLLRGENVFELPVISVMKKAM